VYVHRHGRLAAGKLAHRLQHLLIAILFGNLRLNPRCERVGSGTRDSQAHTLERLDQ
jgi:hypothetical protein